MSHIDKVTHAAFMPDQKLVTLSRDGTVRITDPRTSKTVAKLEIEGTGSTNPRLLAVSPNGRTIVSLWGTTVHIWLPQANHLTSYNLTSTRTTEGWPLSISPDARWMLSRTETGFDIVDVASGRIAWEVHEDGGVGDMVTAASFSADTTVLILGRMNGSVEVWDLDEESGARTGIERLGLTGTK
jgi:WD40 repeat protein